MVSQELARALTGDTEDVLLIDVAEFARLAGTSIDSARKWMYRNPEALPRITGPKRQVLLRRRDVMAFLVRRQFA